MEEMPIVPPPSTVVVDGHKPIIYNANGAILVRKIGY